MSCHFKFRAVFNNFDLLLEGLTLQLSAITMALGLAVGIVMALLSDLGPAAAALGIEGPLRALPSRLCRRFALRRRDPDRRSGNRPGQPESTLIGEPSSQARTASIVPR